MPTSTAPPSRPRKARRETGCRRDRHRTRCTRSSHPHHVALARYYDPVVGRFTATDPLADLGSPATLDAYGYSSGTPVTLSDPTGLLNELGGGASGCNRVCQSKTPGTILYRTVNQFVSHGSNPYADRNDPVITAGTDAGIGAGWVPPAPKQGWLDRWVPALFFDMNRCEGFGKQCAIQFGKMASTLSLALKSALAVEALAARGLAGAGAASSGDDFANWGSEFLDDGARMVHAPLRPAGYAVNTSSQRLGHIFVPKHNLQPLVSTYGTREAVVEQMLVAIQGKTPAAGLFQVATEIGGQTVVVRGAVISGIPRLSTAFTP